MTTTTRPRTTAPVAIPALTAPGIRCPSCAHTVPLLTEGSDLCLRCDSLHTFGTVA